MEIQELVATTWCKHCLGKGYFGDYPCNFCKGTKYEFHWLWEKHIGCPNEHGECDVPNWDENWMMSHPDEDEKHPHDCEGLGVRLNVTLAGLLRTARSIGYSRVSLLELEPSHGFACALTTRKGQPFLRAFSGNGATEEEALLSTIAKAVGVLDE